MVSGFAAYYRDGGKASNGWLDPVAALVKTLPIQISKARKEKGRNGTGIGKSGGHPQTDREAAADLERRQQQMANERGVRVVTPH